MHQRPRLFAAMVVVGLACAAQAADRTEITFADGRIFPESLTSTKNGAVYFGSLGQDSVYRAAPKSAKAETWIAPKTAGRSQPPFTSRWVWWISGSALPFAATSAGLVMP